MGDVTYKLGTIVNRYQIYIPLDEKCLFKKECSKTALKVLGVNDSRIVLNDEYFTRLGIDSDVGDYEINKEKIYINDRDKYFAYIGYTCFTIQNKKWLAIRKKIDRAIDEKMGRFANIDLSFIGKE